MNSGEAIPAVTKKKKKKKEGVGMYIHLLGD